MAAEPSEDRPPVHIRQVKGRYPAEAGRLEPITEPLPPGPVHQGPTPEVLHYDRFCECEVLYENQITVPKRHSLICLCPKCGCVTQD